ncbi:MAG: hypothetical protein LW650_05520 [Planctomycetaceae bacterium]|jgi:hypothetical protein|nr:hypothetical protein [Phycisphaerales bacterium]MCE2652964.1 hypothetical protein [Planctomycetaceae bacterium]
MNKRALAITLLMAAAGTAHAQSVLFNNGTLVTNAGAGADGAANGGCFTGNGDSSAIEAGFTTFGFNMNTAASATGGFRVADDFAVPCGVTWNPSQFRFFTYQTGAFPCSTTITSAEIKIYNGDPRTGGTVIFTAGGAVGGTVTVNTTNIFRTTATTLTSVSRQLQEVVVDMTGCPPLTSGIYWVSMTAAGSVASGPWIAPITPARGSDNSLNSTDAITWTPVDGNGAAAGGGQDLAFNIRGTSAGTPCPPPATFTNVTVPGDGSFGTASAALAAGEVKWFRFNLASAIGPGSRLDIDTEGSTTTGGPFPNDTVIAVYRPDGTIAVVDDDDAAGFTSQATFGSPIGYQTATSNGLNFSGRDGATLPAGDYYVAVVGYATTNNFAAGYTVITNSTATGNINLRVRRVTGVPALSTIRDTVLAAQNMGTINDSLTFTSATGAVAAGTTKWFRFTLPTAVTTADVLDIYTSNPGSGGLAPAVNTSIGLYDANGNRLGANFDSGEGALSLLSFGGGFRPRIGTTWNFYGQNNAAGFTSLPAGTYWLAVTGGDEAVYAATNFDVANGVAANTGNVTVNVRYVVAPPVTPVTPTAIDLGTLSETGVVSNTTTVEAGEVKWFRFTVPETVAFDATLDIDTEGTNLAPANDTTILLYNADGTRPAAGRVDPDQGTEFLSQLSYGTHNQSVAALAHRTDGRDGTMLAPGEYFIAVRAAAGGSTLDNFNVNSDGANAGSLTMNLRYNASAPALGTPIATNDLGTLGGNRTTSFTGLPIRPADVRWYKLTLPVDLPAVGAFYLDIDTAGTTVTPRDDTWIGLYDNNGGLIAENDDAGGAAVVIESQLSFGSTDTTGRPEVIPGATARDGRDGTLAAGTYWLAATMYDATTQFNVDSFRVVTDHVDSSANGYAVNFRYNLPGGACNVADVVGIGGVGVPPDGILTGDDFNAFIGAFAANDLLADIVGIGGEPPADGLLTGDDFNAFIGAFAAGCP